MKRTERLHALSETLRRGGTLGRTAAWLANEFGVSVRTIKRDLDALENSGAPVWSRPGPGGGYGLAGRANLPPITLTPAQAAALLAAVTAAPDAPYSDLAAAGIRKIVDVLDPRTRLKADELARRIWVNAGPPASRAVRSALEQAMSEQLVARIRYTSANGNMTTRDVEPVIFALSEGKWYMIGWCRLRNGMRWFLLQRIGRATVTTVPCEGHEVDEIGIPPATARSLQIEQGQPPLRRPGMVADRAGSAPV